MWEPLPQRRQDVCAAGGTGVQRDARQRQAQHACPHQDPVPAQPGGDISHEGGHRCLLCHDQAVPEQRPRPEAARVPWHQGKCISSVPLRSV